MAMEVFILEVDELPLNKRLKTLQVRIQKDIFTLKCLSFDGEISIYLETSHSNDGCKNFSLMNSNFLIELKFYII